jgi:hypothetical protein
MCNHSADNHVMGDDADLLTRIAFHQVFDAGFYPRSYL